MIGGRRKGGGKPSFLSSSCHGGQRPAIPHVKDGLYLSEIPRQARNDRVWGMTEYEVWQGMGNDRSGAKSTVRIFYQNALNPIISRTSFKVFAALSRAFSAPSVATL